MLAITRRLGEALVIGDDIKITVTETKGDQVKISVDAPDDIAVNREEVHNRIQAEKNGNK